tara:strand:+ start:12521 stop:16522 length:4002 start_codon:yes stop_codon:yes gene_type:complete
MAGESIRSIVQRCYSLSQIHLTQSELDQTSVRPAATTGPLSPATPAGAGGAAGSAVTPPTPNEVIAELVGRCYSPNTGIPNQPNALDQENPRPEVIPPALTPDPMPGDVIRNLVDRCYPTGIIPNNPNDLDKDNPLPQFEAPPLTPDPTPNQVIQQLVNRCYPDLDLTIPPLPFTEEDDFPGFEIDIGDVMDWINGIIPIPYDFTGPIVIVPPDGPKGKTFPIINDDGGQCLELARLDAKGLLKKIGKDKYKHKETGVIYECDGYDEPTETEWGKCVREALECMMRPYIGGQWRPPAPSCDSYWPSGWSSNKNEICIKNCYPERAAVYEHGLISSQSLINVRFAHRNKNGMWAGTVQTTDTDGNNISGYVFNEGGAQIFSNNYSGTFTTGSGGISVTVSVNAIPDGNDYDSEWRIDSWSGSASPGTTWTHNFNLGNNTAYLDFEVFGNTVGDTIYTTDPVSPNGYAVLNNGNPVFHVLKEPIAGKTVPIFNYYSSSKVDSMLSTNPGMPDGPGNGERSYINQHNYIFQYVLGYGFIKQDGAIGYKRKKNDPTQALVRLFNDPPWDHAATIDAEIPMKNPQRYKGKNSYRIPQNPRQDLRVTVDCEHGAAGYENSLGFYLADDNGPQKGYIIVPNAKANESQQDIVVPLKRLREYAGGTMGFFIVPDGNRNNSYDRGDDVDFQSHNGGNGSGFRGNGVGSAENNYCLFSDNRWNPEDEKDYTEWKGSGKQFWEDLVDGDDDYDDMKLYHIVEWRTENDNYDGVLCYVYENEAPPRIMRPLNAQVECDTRLMKSGFKDIVLQRQDCGSMVSGTEQYTIDYECGKCTGGYSNRMNQSQTIEVVTGGTFIFTSGGGITNGVLGECTRFRVRVLKNNNEVYNKKWKAARWPPIGVAITGEISVSAGDTLTFEIPDLISGGPNSSVSPAVHLYNATSAAYESSFNIQLITLNGDDKVAESTGAPATNEQQGQTITTGVGIHGLAMQFAPTNSRQNWQAGSYKDASYHIDKDDSPNGDAATQVWENGSVVNMDDPASNNVPDHPGEQAQPNDVRGSANTNAYFPNSNGYIDTGFLRNGLGGYPPRGSNQFSRADEDLLEELTGNYNHMLEEYLVTRMDFYDGVPSLLSNSKVDKLKQKMPHTAVRGGTPWYIAAGDSGRGIDTLWYSTIDDIWHDNPLRGPVTFVHDYILDNLTGKHDNMLTDPAKVRIGITFYSLPSTSITRSPTSSSDYYWQAIIEVIDVLNAGTGYQTGMEFTFHWPPLRDDRTEQAGTPYYPDKVDTNWKYPKQNLRAYFESGNVDRYAKEAIYQESHRTDSPIWYYASDDKKRRVRFKLIVTDTN